jgi:hypothetical protein
MINLRPSLGNRSRGVDDPATQGAIRTLVDATMTVAEQLGNIGSEISRTANEYGSTAASLQHYFDAFAACRPRT